MKLPEITTRNHQYRDFPVRINITQYKAVNYVKRKKGGHYTFNPRRWSAIIGILKGEVEFIFDNNTINCQAEDVIFIPQNSKYTAKYIEDPSVIIFDFYTDNNSFFAPIKTSGLNLYSSYKKIEEYSFKPSESSYYAIMSELYFILSKIVMSDNQKDIILNNAIKIINENFHDPSFFCKNISDMLNISESYLRARFKKVFGISPSRYMTMIRMQEAVTLLSSNVSITETALMVGYSDIFQFSKAYKKYFGYPPSETKHII